MRLRSRIYVAAILAFAVPAHADGPVLHEYIPPDPAEDLRMGATTPDGAMPAAIDTRSGVLGAQRATYQFRGQSGCLRRERHSGQHRRQLPHRSRYLAARLGAL